MARRPGRVPRCARRDREKQENMEGGGRLKGAATGARGRLVRQRTPAAGAVKSLFCHATVAIGRNSGFRDTDFAWKSHKHRRCAPRSSAWYSKKRGEGTCLRLFGKKTDVGRAQAQRRSVRDSGICRTRLPVAAKIALQIAGATGGSAGSPRPVVGLSVFRKYVSILIGASVIRIKG